jgi:hypothetical protein
VAVDRDGRLVEGQPVAGRDPELFFDDIDPGERLGDGVFDLDARVNFEEVKRGLRAERLVGVAVGVLFDEELDGPGVGVVGGGDASASRPPDALARRASESAGDGPSSITF